MTQQMPSYRPFLVANKKQSLYHKDMTIKRRLFLSNIRMVFITVTAIIVSGSIVRYVLFRAGRFDHEIIERFRDFSNPDVRISIWFMVLTIFIILVSVTNNIITHRMTRRIVKPLEPLSEGVKQIRDNNLKYRINYKNEDEFRPVCDAFNEMAARLEASTLQQKKNEANRRELIAGISHDLRTPLTSVKGYIEGIKTGVASTPEMQEKYLSIIEKKTQDIERIIEQLFLFSKLDMDEFPVNIRSVDIVRAISDMIEELTDEYEQRGLIINFTETQKNIFINADVLMFRNVVINILDNSVKYKTKEKGHIEISAELINDFILLRFADDGPGVNSDMLSKLFDVFYRTDQSRSKLGSGLGLAISEKIIERMGGKIYAETPAAGGLAIIIKLPVISGEKNNV